MRVIPKWQVGVAFLPLLLALGQLGYLISRPIHALVGVVLGAAAGLAGSCSTSGWLAGAGQGARLALVMIGTLVLCFVVVELIGAALGALYPAQLGS